MSKRALITGITGMVGSHLADYLYENSDWQIYGLARWRSPLDNLERLAGPISQGERVHLLYGDLRDEISLRHAIGQARPDYVFNLAAQSFPQTSFTSPLDTMEVNVQGLIRLLEILRDKAPEAIIHVCSSSEVYGKVSRDRTPIDEQTPFHPASPYAASRVGTDLVGRYYAKAFGMKAVVTRMFTHTGPRRGDVFAESSFAKQIAMIEAEKWPPVVKVGNLESVRTVTDVRDAVRAYHLLVTESPRPGEFYNIGGDATYKIGEILEFLLGLSPARDRIEVQEDPARMRPIDSDLQIPDTSKFSSHYDWQPRIPFEQTMQDLLDYWRKRITGGAVTINR